MASQWWSVVVDCADPKAQAYWWAEALGHTVVYEAEDEVAIIGGTKEEPKFPGLCFVRVPDGKTVKNRLHIDLNPDDQAAEVARLEALGARRVDVGQGEVRWVVLADPEDNEFCVLTARPQE